MARLAPLTAFALAACASDMTATPTAIDQVRPVVAEDRLQGRWAIAEINGQPASNAWIEFGGEGLGTVTRRADGGLNVGSPQPRTRASLGCNEWNPNGWARNGDKLVFGVEMSSRTERGCDPDMMALEEQAFAVLSKPMTMELEPPGSLRLINEHGTVDLVRQ